MWPSSMRTSWYNITVLCTRSQLTAVVKNCPDVQQEGVPSPSATVCIYPLTLHTGLEGGSSPGAGNRMVMCPLNCGKSISYNSSSTSVRDNALLDGGGTRGSTGNLHRCDPIRTIMSALFLRSRSGGNTQQESVNPIQQVPRALPYHSCR